MVTRLLGSEEILNENKLDSMFNARSIAVVGASNTLGKVGCTILKNLIDGGFSGEIYPINPKDSEVQGYRAYKKLNEVEHDIDLAVIAIPSKLVPASVKEAGEKAIKNIIIITGGFREIGKDELEKEMLNIAKDYDISILGPNCQGLNYTPNNMCASWPLIKEKGPMAIIAQSGTIAATFGMWAEEEGIGISSLISLGNKSGLSELSFMEFLAKDEKTKVIALNIEGIKDGRKFMEVSKKIVGSKSVVVLKPGRTERGKRAAQSHTKSIAGSDEIFSAACKQTGIIRAETFTELYDFSKALGFLKKPKGNNVLIITSSGGSGILATDVFEENKMVVRELDSSLKEVLKSELPSYCVVSNPIDLTGDTDALRYEKCVKSTMHCDYIDMFLLIFGDPIPGACEVVERLRGLTDKPIVVCYLGGGETERLEAMKMHKLGIPVFQTPERAAKAASVLMLSRVE